MFIYCWIRLLQLRPCTRFFIFINFILIQVLTFFPCKVSHIFLHSHHQMHSVGGRPPFLKHVWFPSRISKYLARTLVTINVRNNILTLIMSKSSLIYLKLRKLQEYLSYIFLKLKNRKNAAANINLNVCLLTRILMVNFPTSNWVHAFEVAFTVIFI